MRLYLDDCRSTPDGWFRAFTAPEAITLLETGEVKEISFDHDLGACGACLATDPDARECEHHGSGYTVACWIEGAAHDGKISHLVWHIHSDNSAGRKRIQMAMNSAERFWEE